MENYVMPILLAIIGVIGSIFGFVQFLITRKDKKKNNNEEVLKAINEMRIELANTNEEIHIQKQNQLRTEILVMMNHYENETFEIMRLAHKYFVEEGGDFTLTSIFAQFLKQHNIEKPLWFDETK